MLRTPTHKHTLHRIETWARHHTMASTSSRNVKNAVIALLVPLPSILFYLSFLNNYDSAIATGGRVDPSFWSTLWAWCYHHPLLLANALFFLNVNLLFWIIGQIQSSHWVHTYIPFSSKNFTFFLSRFL